MEWLDDGTGRLFDLVAGLPDAALAEPTLLPGWDRRTLLAHLALNAAALSNLVTWARTGVETPMYASLDQRAADIAALATEPPGTIRASMVDNDTALRRDLRLLSPVQWSAEVRTARGRPIPASEIPWMRNREVWVHAVDLDAGFSFVDIPEDVLSALLDDAAALMSVRPDAVAVTGHATDTGGRWSFGPTADAVLVEAPLADLCAYALGRSTRPDHPPLPAWL